MQYKSEEKPITNSRKLNSVCLDAQLAVIRSRDFEVASIIREELSFQKNSLRMIASENYASLPVLLAMGTCLSDKYAEGNIAHRFYAGCNQINAIEELAENRLMELFPGFDGCSVQPHSGSDANLLAYMVAFKVLVEQPFISEINARTKKNYTINSLPPDDFDQLREVLSKQTLMGFDLRAGGHLTHGFRGNISSKLFRPIYFTINDKEQIDYDSVKEIACKERPLIIVAGISAYPRNLNFYRLRMIADACGAILLADIAHISGLVCSGHLRDEYCPIKYADIMTMTTHKTLRGPRGGAILAKKPFAQELKKACPLMMGGPLSHVMAAKAIAFGEALKIDFKEYIENVVFNARTLAEELTKKNVSLYTGGTSNHLLVLNVTESFHVKGEIAENLLESVGIISNKNMLPGDIGSQCSGIRFGTAAITSRGLGPNEMCEIADIIHYVLSNITCINNFWSLSESVIKNASFRVRQLCDAFPMPYEIPEFFNK